ncbi:MAG: site-2 protease family protein [Candidatus Hadarchaeales archaeon]
MSERAEGELVPGECPRCGRGMEVGSPEMPPWLSDVLDKICSEFDVLDFISRENGVEAEVRSGNTKRAFGRLAERLRPSGYVPVIRERNGALRLVVLKYPRPGPSNPAVNVLLLSLTCMSTFLAGYFMIFGSIGDAALFSASLLAMLGIHELGHKLAARRNRVESTLPYFIPAPNLLGTMGAIISVRSPIPNRESLIEMGVAGPLAGFAAAVPVMAMGLWISAPDPQGTSFVFVPVIFALGELLVFGHLPPSLRLNPLIFSSWVMFLLTMLNLVPAGQLDGGHVARGLMKRETHYSLTMGMGLGLLVSGMLWPEMPFWFWGLLILLFFRTYHPGALDDISGVSRKHVLLGLVAMAVFALCLPLPAGSPQA